MDDIDTIAALITEDPDVMNEMPIRDIPGAIKRRLSSKRKRMPQETPPEMDPEATAAGAGPSQEQLAAAAAEKERGQMYEKVPMAREARMQAYGKIYSLAKAARASLTSQEDVGTLAAAMDQYKALVPEIAHLAQPLTMGNIKLKQHLDNLISTVQQVTRSNMARTQPRAMKRADQKRSTDRLARHLGQR